MRLVRARRRGMLSFLNRKWNWVLLVFTVCAVTLLAYAPSGASDANQVAVVVDFGDGHIATRCVGFSEDSISGFEALSRTGLPVETDFQSGGAAICRLDGQGCPPEDCFCSCRGGGDCKYWSYWHLKNGAWNYSAAGSALYQLRDGDIDGWVWGLGSVTQASPPPVIPFGEICVNEAANSPTPTATIEQPPTSTPMILPTQPPVDNPQPATIAPQVTATSLPIVTSTDEPTVQPADAGPALPGEPIARAPTTTRPPPTPEEGEQVVAQSPVSAADFSSAPDTSGGGLSSALLDDNQPLATLEIVSPELSEPIPAPDETEISIAPVAVDVGGSEPVDEAETSAFAIAAVVGEGAGLPARQSGSSPVTDQSPTNGVAYLGFVGMMLFLAALGLLVYRRRAIQVRENER